MAAPEIRVGVDVDGVLANFTQSYAKIITKHTGIEFLKLDDIKTFPSTWYWEREAMEAVGFPPEKSKAIEKALWVEIAASRDFWRKLQMYPDSSHALRMLFRLKADAVYFITSRVGWQVKKQTEDWLFDHKFYDPTVLISSAKGAVCKALNLTHYIDDRIENCLDVRDTSPATKGFMLARPWNTPQEGIPRIEKLVDFIETLRTDGKLPPEVGVK